MVSLNFTKVLCVAMSSPQSPRILPRPRRLARPCPPPPLSSPCLSSVMLWVPPPTPRPPPPPGYRRGSRLPCSTELPARPSLTPQRPPERGVGTRRLSSSSSFSSSSSASTADLPLPRSVAPQPRSVADRVRSYKLRGGLPATQLSPLSAHALVGPTVSRRARCPSCGKCLSFKLRQARSCGACCRRQKHRQQLAECHDKLRLGCNPSPG